MTELDDHDMCWQGSDSGDVHRVIYAAFWLPRQTGLLHPGQDTQVVYSSFRPLSFSPSPHNCWCYLYMPCEPCSYRKPHP